ncbi:MAG: MEDS domain-containing protein [Actinomycetota bacterium]|nr:MEDS domain-containing protein [Actinomycetota bacterium]
MPNGATRAAIAARGRLVQVSPSSALGRDVRIYGEMVALLWEEGNILAAMALEDLWNQFAGSRAFSLMCAYPMNACHSHHRISPLAAAQPVGTRQG